METQKINPIPEFMLTEKGQFGNFKFNAVLGIKFNRENPNNHTFLVQLQNIKNNYAFQEEMSPELLRFRYKLGRTYKKGKLVKSEAKDKRMAFVMNASWGIEQVPLFTALSKTNIMHILGSQSKNSFTFGANFCYVHETDEAKIIIPSYTVLLYYYLRSSSMTKAVFKGNHHLMYDEINSKLDNKNDAHLILNSNFSYLDGPFIYRFASNNIAGKAFVDIFRYISTKIAKADMNKDDKENGKNKNIDLIPIKTLFPIKELFVLHVRYEVLPELSDNGKPIYYAHEIMNDESTLDFEKLTVTKIKRVKLSDDENKPPKDFKFIGRKAKKTLNKTTNKTPSRKYSTSYLQQMEDEKNLGLAGKIINHNILEVVEDDESQVQPQQSNNIPELSFAQAQNNGDENTRQVSLESRESKLMEIPPNYDLFKICIEYIENSGLVSDFEFDDSYDEIPHSLMKNGQPYSLCEIHGRVKTYATCSFVFNELNVVLVEVEPKGVDASIWVLISKQNISEEQVYSLLSQRYKNDAKMEDLKVTYSDSNKLKFEIKKHALTDEHGDIYYEKLGSWLFTLLGKIW